MRAPLLILALFASSADAQTVLQWVVPSTGYPSSGQAVSIEKCEEVRQANLSAAPSFGYTVSHGTITDPVSGISIEQSCAPIGGHEPAPAHPVSGTLPPRPSVTCPTPSQSLVYLAMGQSMAANDGGARYSAGANVYAFASGACYRATDPLPGASGVDGSIWSRLGDKLASANPGKSIVIAAIGEGGSSVADWATGGWLNSRLVNAVNSLSASGYTITAMLWHQGETDVGDISTGFPSAEWYRDKFLSMLGSVRVLGVTAPIYVAKSTICNMRASASYPPPQAVVERSAQWHISKEQGRRTIRGAQWDYQPAGVINGGGVRRGPDTDALGPEYRYDGCHLSARGLDSAAALWLEKLTAP